MASSVFTGSIWKKFRATVVNDIWPEVLFFTMVAVMVTLVSSLTETSLAISSQMLTVLGTVLGLVISFRTSTAYERFSEGRKLWTNISIASRNLAQIIWLHVPFDRVDKATGNKKPMLEVMIEKKSMINLIQAFSVAVKHSLRGEGGVYYADLYPLISFLPRFSHPRKCTEEEVLPLWGASGMDLKKHHTIRSMTLNSKETTLNRFASEPTPQTDEEMGELRNEKWFDSFRRSDKKRFDPESALPVVPSEHPLMPSRNPPKTSFFSCFPFLRILKPLIRPFKRMTEDEPPLRRSLTGKKIRPQMADSNVPIEITLFLSTYFASLMRQGLLTPASATAMVNAISGLQDTVTNLERIKSTPLPFAYQAHLRMSLWLYLFFLPFQIFGAFQWLTIPATAFASFLLLGFLEIGQEIENPFNYDLNDLDLDHFCLAVQRELHEITAHTAPDVNEFIFTEWNQPFAPGDRRSAKEMLHDLNHPYHDDDECVHSIRKTLLKSWREVDQITRKH
ncbi:unnamed protein product [Somion occarium]|uniref:Uncharacterized protein n=1 Tax=Somion occarium TaxID=3059160 RepID=A0ABP1DN22_9APHY